MLTLPNFLSCLRIPLALFFLSEKESVRFAAILFSMSTDCLDGYLARKHKNVTQLGALLDPITDKFFVFFVLGILIKEHKIEWWEVLAMMCRDFAVICFGIYLMLRKKLFNYKFGAIWSGKFATATQFIVLVSLALNFTVPVIVYVSFIFLGIAAFVELYWTRKAKGLMA